MVLSMNKWKGKVAVVTGASSGIGEAVVKKLVEEGLIVVGLARRLDRMQDQAKKLLGQPGKFHPLECDLSVESNILACFDYIRKTIGPVHVLVNNAGCCNNTTLSEGDTSSWNQVFAVNVLGLCIATREAVKDMKNNSVEGHIIHVNSIAGHFSVNIDNLNVYPASKFAVTALSDTLRKELAKSKRKIKVTSISPGVVATELFAVSGLQDIQESIEKEAVPALAPEDIADAIGYILSTPPIVNISELTIQPVNEML
ncbi:unnamed protein product [Psylliodes chrysocephalus]|uniref:Farnesol dehydrogenase-like n=1 Tax=Psylliodes chrysocephalus TaxID=3402493 RepID=A0A9P0CID0_9CUCU|nr:unnamed protein product [Psylliodes chrysocephala]